MAGSAVRRRLRRCRRSKTSLRKRVPDPAKPELILSPLLLEEGQDPPGPVPGRRIVVQPGEGRMHGAQWDDRSHDRKLSGGCDIGVKHPGHIEKSCVGVCLTDSDLCAG